MRAYLCLALTLLVISATDVIAGPVSRILDGKTGIGKVRARTAVIKSEIGEKSKLCTATVLNEYWLLTAAHCEIKYGDDVWVGRKDIARDPDNYVKVVIKHSGYEKQHPLPKHDIALVRLEYGIFKNDECDELARVTLYDNTRVPYDDYGDIAGYGYFDLSKNDGEFRETPLTIHGTKTCRSLLEEVIGEDGAGFNSKHYLCAGKNTVTCPGDYGGPLLVDGVGDYSFVQIGVVGGGGTCGEKGTPAVFTSVRGHVEWILDNIDGDVLITRSITNLTEELSFPDEDSR